ncbi:unnamed protein product, partial [Prunus brigantina]
MCSFHSPSAISSPFVLKLRNSMFSPNQQEKDRAATIRSITKRLLICGRKESSSCRIQPSTWQNSLMKARKTKRKRSYGEEVLDFAPTKHWMTLCEVEDPLRGNKLRDEEDPRPTFISALLKEPIKGKIQPFSSLLRLKQEQIFKWEEQHQQAFEEIKRYLSNPPVLSPPKRGRPLKLYISASEVSIGSLLVQDNKEGKEHAIYYLSRTLTEVERKYSAIERLCLALYFTAVKLRHYMLPYTIYIIAKTDLIKYMLTRPMLRGRIGKWTLALTEFAFRYVPQKAVKGQAVADFLADHPGEEIENMDSLDIANADLLTRAHTCLNNPIYSVHLTPWKLYFDGSRTDIASGAGIVLEEPLGIRHCYSFQLNFQCTNNRAEYEALIIGLEMLVELGIQSVEILGDSMLDEVLLRCLGKKEYMKVMGETHEGICGAHQGGRKMCWLIRRYGYFWPTMMKDCIDYSKGCESCQRHGPIQQAPSVPMNPVVKPWPFRGWAM